MPKRSNRFQKLIHLIQSVLANECRVTESALLADKQTGSSAEVDILVEGEIGGTEISIGIECRDRKRKATVEWVREMKGKHEQLPIDKTILVSSSGYSEEALRKSQAWGIEALSINEAESTKWDAYVKALSNLKFAGFTFSLIHTRVSFGQPIENPKSIFSLDSLVIDEATGNQGSLSQYSNSLIRDSDVAELVMEKWLQEGKPADFETTLNWVPNEMVKIVGSDNSQYDLESIHCAIRVTVDEAPITLQASKFRNVDIASGEVEDVFGKDPNRKILYVTTEEDGRMGPGAILTPDGKVREMRRSKSNDRQDA